LTKTNIYSVILLALWLAVIFYFSSQNYEQQSIRPFLSEQLPPAASLKESLPDWGITYRHSSFTLHQNPYRFIEFLVRKGAHLTVYAVLAIIAFVSLRKLGNGPFRRGGIALLLVLGVACLDEWNQSRFVRTPALEDVGLDLAGGILGIACYILLNKLIRRKA
jgi:VanZ family protein